jgi:site-specific DNA-methyltransferase (cytosine-N4-specific)
MTAAEDFYKKQIIKADWDFISSKSEPLHSIHPYPAKFIPDIPRALINSLPIPKNTIILDPFCGSGVTLVEAQRKGLKSVGVDLNPIACLLSRVKTQDLPESFLKVAAKIDHKCRNFSKGIAIPPIPNLDHWFKKEIQEGLAMLIQQIKSVKDEALKDALNFCVSSIIVKVSNQESDTRYAAISNNWLRDDVFKLFYQAAEKLTKVKAINAVRPPSVVLNKNSLNLSKKDFSGKVGLVVTSPPYPNAYEYWLYHKYRMWWLGYDPLEVKEQEIGARAHYFKKNHQTEVEFEVQMAQLFDNLFKLCADQAYVCFIIGRSKIHGRIIENEKLIADLGSKRGFTHITTVSRTIKSSRKSFNLSHARIQEEFIVILQK